MQLLCFWLQKSGPVLSVGQSPGFCLAHVTWLHMGNNEMSPPLIADVLEDLVTKV